MNENRKILIIGTGSDVMALAAKYPLTITAAANGNTADIRISGIIADWQNSAADFRSSIDSIKAQGVKDVNLYINSPGGSVFQANEIANVIQEFEGNIKGYGGALVASAASYLALICSSFEMAENGQYMYHKPSGVIVGNEDTVESDLQLLKNLTNQYRTAYAQKTGLSEDEIESRWSKGDVWLTAQQAKEQGFITAVTSKAEKVPEAYRDMFVALGAPQVPIENKTENSDMKNRNVIIAALKLPADATDEQIEAAAKKAQEGADRAAEIEANANKNKKTEVEAFVDNLITEKKATAEQKAGLITMGMADLEGLKAYSKTLIPVEKPQPGSPSASDENRRNWTMEDYQEKDPQALAEMMVKDPQAFAKLEKAYFGK